MKKSQHDKIRDKPAGLNPELLESYADMQNRPLESYADMQNRPQPVPSHGHGHGHENAIGHVHKNEVM